MQTIIVVAIGIALLATGIWLANADSPWIRLVSIIPMIGGVFLGLGVLSFSDDGAYTVAALFVLYWAIRLITTKGIFWFILGAVAGVWSGWILYEFLLTVPYIPGIFDSLRDFILWFYEKAKV